ncbi:MAG: tetratricopeptide repeat protein [Candidatus Babeliaceae bacterium]|jgi:ADP-heptose:LPS heptosyltransferase
MKSFNYCRFITICAVICSFGIGAVEHASKLSSYSPEDLYMLGKNKRMQGDYKRALPYFRAAFARDPQHRQAHIELATSYLACENFVRGFDLLHSYVSSSLPADKLWRGENLDGKSIAVYASHWGIGDDIMFSRYLRCLKEAGAHVTLVVPEKLQRLFTFNLHVDSIHVENLTVSIQADEIYFDGTSLLCRNAVDGFDYHAHIMSLPKLCKVRKANVPSEPYFAVDKKLYEKYKNICAQDNNFKVGICWYGAERRDAQLQQRSMNLHDLAPLLSQPGITFYSLQYGKAHAASNIIAFDDFDMSEGAFMDSIALMKNLDLVITIDTSVAHLAGALGVETWVMLPRAADWRYAAHDSECLWYPTMRLFKQPVAGDWQSVVNAIVDLLHNKQKRSL